MTTSMSNLSLEQLKHAVALKEQIELLERELARVLGGAPTSAASAARAVAPSKRGEISAAGRARIAAAQRARWAKQKKAAGPKATAKARPAQKPSTASKSAKGVISAAGRARLSALAKARWAKARKAGKKSLQSRFPRSPRQSKGRLTSIRLALN